MQNPKDREGAGEIDHSSKWMACLAAKTVPMPNLHSAETLAPVTTGSALVLEAGNALLAIAADIGPASCHASKSM
jgi:hypothetical protein